MYLHYLTLWSCFKAYIRQFSEMDERNLTDFQITINR